MKLRKLQLLDRCHGKFAELVQLFPESVKKYDIVINFINSLKASTYGKHSVGPLSVASLQDFNSLSVIANLDQVSDHELRSGHL